MIEDTDATDNEIHEVAVSASLPATDGFWRSHPAEMEGPEEAWNLARSVVDYGCAILSIGARMRPESRLRDAVLAALLRRLLITSEGAIVLLSRGLIEPALAQMRTLLDIELAFRLIHRDQSELFAKRLAAFHYLTYQAHGEDMLSSRHVRDAVLDGPQQIPELITITKSYARFLEGAVFDDVRDDIKASRLWHGFKNVKEAFQEIGHEHDYFVTYDSATWFVHAVNVDHDFSEPTESGWSLRPLVERNPVSIQPMLGHVVLRAIDLISIYLKDTGFDLDQRSGGKTEIRLDDGSTFSLGSITGLQMLAVRRFHVR